jgi:hypothetical protein
MQKQIKTVVARRETLRWLPGRETLRWLPGSCHMTSRDVTSRKLRVLTYTVDASLQDKFLPLTRKHILKLKLYLLNFNKAYILKEKFFMST